MHSNIEQAVAELLSCQKEVNIDNLLPTYLRTAGFGCSPTADSILAFQRAMEKYPDGADKKASPYPALIARIRQRYWFRLLGGTNPEDEAKCRPCNCCGNMVIMNDKNSRCVVRKLEVKEDVKEEEAVTKVKRHRNKRKTKRKEKSNVRFDPYGPSTSSALV
ncbi:hypothetical protein BDQ17DRAFT_1429205 [Cyathus striatus]|nr:hypothetical protein BDQ17DRAFT_1429205 [Cyathus striatus]